MGEQWEALAEVFRNQAFHCRDLGSPFTADLCELFAERLDDTTAVGRHVINWPGSASHRADAVPLRLCGALHALVLTSKDAQLKEHYPPVSERIPPWDVIEAVLVRHEEFILDWMTSPPQTNEVARSNMIFPGLLTVADRLGLPIRLLEIGSSGGLNLQMDRFGFTFDGVVFGDRDSDQQLTPNWNGPLPPSADVTINSRLGCDINPLDPTDETDALRLRAYLWADQTERVARLNHAIDLARAHPAPVEKTDAISFMKANLQVMENGEATVFYSTIAWQYLTDADKVEGETLMRAVGERATKDCPLVWIRFEGDGGDPGGAISMKLWSGGPVLDVMLGRADFHGRWVNWVGL